jgi:lysophospholipid acyltransferase (LPLAT)-like uncharacterized protein
MIKRWFRNQVLPMLVYWLYRLWTRSWRIRYYESDSLKSNLREKNTIIFAHWHGDELAITHLVPRYNIATMTSTSADGSLIDQVILRLGGATARGSSTRGAVSALRGLIRLLKNGHNASMAVDGPKGPYHQVKPGVFELARLANAIIIPVGVYAPKTLVFKKSWNKAHLPYPFSQFIVFFGEPLPLAKTYDPRDPGLARQLAQAISDASHQAAKLIAD